MVLKLVTLLTFHASILRLKLVALANILLTFVTLIKFQEAILVKGSVQLVFPLNKKDKFVTVVGKVLGIKVRLFAKAKAPLKEVTPVLPH